jgi:hypothetical protein
MYVKVTNGAVDQYPYTVGDLRRDNPNTSFPKRPSDDLLASWGLYPVTINDTPSIDERTQTFAIEDAPTLSDGSWSIDYTVSSKTADEIAEYDEQMAATNRNLRDIKLAETDFYALSDVTMSAEMTTYRQALRDITSHANWPNLNDDDWPTKP